MKTYQETVQKLAKIYQDRYYGGSNSPEPNEEYQMVAFVYETSIEQVAADVRDTFMNMAAPK